MTVVFHDTYELWSAYKFRWELGYSVLYDICKGKVVEVVVPPPGIFRCAACKGDFCLHVQKMKHLDFSAFVADAELQVAVFYKLNKLAEKSVKFILMCLMKNDNYVVVVYHRNYSLIPLLSLIHI